MPLPKKEFFTMEDMTGSLFLKFYSEQIIEYWGTLTEKAEVAKHAKIILDINEEMKAKRAEIKAEKDENKKEQLKKELDNLIEKRQIANDDNTQYCESVIESQGYYKLFCDHLKAIPCVPNAGTYDANDCYYVMLIKHDKDYLKDDVWTPTAEKAHYHLAIRTAPVPGKRVRQIRIKNWLNDIIKITYRQGIDDNLMKQQGIDVCRSYNDCCLYLLHATVKSQQDGKYPYSKDELVTNMTEQYVSQILLGMKRLDGSMEKLTLKDWENLEKEAINCGLAGMKWKEFIAEKSFEIRSRLRSGSDKANEIKSSFIKAKEQYLDLTRPKFIRNSIYIEGMGNMGKTATSKLVLKKLGFSYDNIFDVGKGTAKYDAYNEQDVMICEDRGLDDIRRVCESNYCRLYQRGKGEALWCGELVIITSNVSFQRFCIDYTLGRRGVDKTMDELSKSDKDSVKATMSRFTHMKCDDRGLLAIMKVSEREDGTKRLDMACFAYNFWKYYNEIRWTYLKAYPIHVTDELLENIDFEDIEMEKYHYEENVNVELAYEAWLNQYEPKWEDFPDELKYDGKIRFGWYPDNPMENPFTGTAYEAPGELEKAVAYVDEHDFDDIKEEALSDDKEGFQYVSEKDAQHMYQFYFDNTSDKPKLTYSEWLYDKHYEINPFI